MTKEGNPPNQTHPNHEISVDDATARGGSATSLTLRHASLDANREAQSIFIDMFVLFYLQLRWFDPSQAGEMRRGRGGGSSVSLSKEKETEA